ncbi:MAG: S8 family serine peptidase [Candidatus Schekmanbacteria bacterium]|nr:S8 family serine peptidase [Candidatus Schekmanbacteria bacterium]
MKKMLSLAAAVALVALVVTSASAGRPEYKAGELFCKVGAKSTDFSAKLASAGAYVKRNSLQRGWAVVAVAPGSERALAKQLGCDLNTLYYPTGINGEFVGTLATVNDPWSSYQLTWDGNQKVGNFAAVQATAAWDVTDGSGATIAVIDTGYTTAAGDSPENLLQGYDFANNDADTTDHNGHGTHVSHTIAEGTNNAVAAAGLAYGANVLPVKVFPDAGGGASCADIVDGVSWAADQGANVANMSLGGSSPCPGMAEALDAAAAKGMLSVCAAGNDGKGTVSYPAASPGCVAVSALDTQAGGIESEQLASFSNYGNEIEVTAPGVAILQATCIDQGSGAQCGGWMLSGTSMASPHAAAVAGLIFAGSASSTVSVDAVRDQLSATAKDLGSAGWDNKFGNGLVQAYDALQ